MLLKNEAVIEVINDGVEINLSTDPDLIEENKENINIEKLIKSFKKYANRNVSTVYYNRSGEHSDKNK